MLTRVSLLWECVSPLGNCFKLRLKNHEMTAPTKIMKFPKHTWERNEGIGFFCFVCSGRSERYLDRRPMQESVAMGKTCRRSFRYRRGRSRVIYCRAWGGVQRIFYKLLRTNTMQAETQLPDHLGSWDFRGFCFSYWHKTYIHKYMHTTEQ